MHFWQPMSSYTSIDFRFGSEMKCTCPSNIRNRHCHGENSSELSEPVVSANAYLGAKPIADALQGDARIVITGRVADASLTVGPAMHRFGWSWTDWDKLAAASVAGHLIECGTQVCGGFSTDWLDLPLPLGPHTTINLPVGRVRSNPRRLFSRPRSPASRAGRLRQVVASALPTAPNDRV